MKEKTDIVVLDRIDYDELVKQANRTDSEIEERAKRIYLDKNEIPVRIEFDEWRNENNFSVPVGYVRGSSFWETLDEVEPQITAWMEVNMHKYGKKMKENHDTARSCKGLRKQVANLQESQKRLRMRFSMLIGYAIVITIILIWLSLLLVSGLQSLLK